MPTEVTDEEFRGVEVMGFLLISWCALSNLTSAERRLGLAICGLALISIGQEASILQE
jgi:hypothetical protein